LLITPPPPPPVDVIVENIDDEPVTPFGDPVAPPAPTVTGYVVAVVVNPVGVTKGLAV
jgi:hypothetical protein